MAESPVYNASLPTGGDPLKVNVNLQYAGVEWNYVYIILCSFIVFLIIPGLGLFYGGLTRRKSALALLFQSFMVVAVITFQWMFWGYSLAYARDASPFIGNLKNIGLRNVMIAPSPGSADLPEIVFCFYQLLFCACTVLILVGGAFERGNMIPTLIFSFCWATVVYCPLACWTWNANGWLYNLPSLDFAGGGPVHIASGCSALAYAMVLGKRRDIDSPKQAKPHNVTMVFLGTSLIWTGWLGFNGGSTLNASVRAMLVVFNTNTAAAAGIIGWVLVDYIRHRGKFSVVGACEGAIAGLVGITPAAGFMSVWLAALIGFLTSIVCALLENINEWINIDEGLHVFKLHGIGGMVGSFLTGIFASKSIAALDGFTEITGGIDGNGKQVGKQLAEICVISLYSFIVSCILLYIMKYIPGMQLRVDEEVEMVGLDRAQFVDEQIGERGLLEGFYGASSPGSVLNGQFPVVVGSQEVPAQEDKK
ncbi:uncharacterized protein N7515_009188 [Penicillium bovifimosum]|uniref:Ammonium transporter n=1 Tax=Penicillium bovifimosum TaxID=126998 RepID=A0A9W9GK29_9EURO|nr:uncharacterized protein N7515_009188 [Penicillium bovifimosum]KAJ5121227.1 hypothetical protein N7515_009188 [Penicillium bovifimosum]